jgi:hypothetical protein
MFSSGDFAHHNDCSQRDRHSATRAGLRRHDDVNWSGSARFARGEHEAATVEIGSEIRSARRAASRSGLKLALPELCAGTTRVPHRCRGCSPGVTRSGGTRPDSNGARPYTLVMAIGEVDWYDINSDLSGELNGLIDLGRTF